MKPPFDPDSLGDVPDPAAELAPLPPPPRRFQPVPRAPTRADRATTRARALAGALVYSGVLLVLFNKRADLHAVPGRTLLLELAIPLGAGLLAFAAATAPGRAGVGWPKTRLVAVALCAPALFALGSWLAGPRDFDPEPFVGHGIRCLVVTGLFTLGPLLFAAWAFRGAFVVSAGWRAAALGVACAALGATAMSLICSVGTPAHVIVGHGGFMVIAGVAGAAFGRRIARV
jgi:hypothetical protein